MRNFFKNLLFAFVTKTLDLNNKLNRLHKRFLRLIFNDKRSTFRKLLDKDSSNTHQKSLPLKFIKLCDEGKYKLRH